MKKESAAAAGLAVLAVIIGSLTFAGAWVLELCDPPRRAPALAAASKDRFREPGRIPQSPAPR